MSLIPDTPGVRLAQGRAEHVDHLYSIIERIPLVEGWELLDLMIDMGVISASEAWPAISERIKQFGKMGR